MKFLASVIFAVLLANVSLAAEGYFRSPSLRGDLVVFTAKVICGLTSSAMRMHSV